MVLETTMVETMGLTARQQKVRLFSNLDNSTNYVYSLILESFYIQDDDCAWWVD